MVELSSERYGAIAPAQSTQSKCLEWNSCVSLSGLGPFSVPAAIQIQMHPP
jgi:hypothetical protein